MPDSLSQHPAAVGSPATTGPTHRKGTGWPTPSPSPQEGHQPAQLPPIPQEGHRPAQLHPHSGAHAGSAPPPQEGHRPDQLPPAQEGHRRPSSAPPAPDPEGHRLALWSSLGSNLLHSRSIIQRPLRAQSHSFKKLQKVERHQEENTRWIKMQRLGKPHVLWQLPGHRRPAGLTDPHCTRLGHLGPWGGASPPASPSRW